ncbi:DNA polymerase III subunit delta' [Sphingomonas sp. MAH-20]|jgi:DNA polymerase-3 subunit delta'|uniref:DNA polymerase III subunit delta n=1 Tax=Sphingomonas horti TaxID=2682842 RepID=A0A6I4J502_9SPHN|nr:MULTISPECIES: DNA polymerase III subunit delta' [Sphingomonas]MBA2919360.1 DNA polymerase III subunit delta' [Sphingomonas sp. CGMCC 1.13658]MVO78241.1 DNA polymerase III subunit delta' [Sphingomonas horti]
MTSLLGHDEQAAAFLAAMRSTRLHHAWLLTGPRGLGKASFARAAALRLLAEAADPELDGQGLDVDPEHRIARLFAARSHPDFRLVEREPWKQDEIIPEIDRKGDEPLARSIRVKQIRMLERVLSVSPALSARRAIVIDSADDLERSAANALLKSLEEPPAGTVFFLVSHMPGRLLPTIRSRCRTLRFGPLSDEQMRVVLRRALPATAPDEIDALMKAGEGAPGQALRFAGLDIGSLDAALETMARTGDPSNATRASLARSLALKAAHPRYEALLERAPALIAREARGRRGPALDRALELWGRARDLAASAIGLSLDPQATAFQLGSYVAQLAEE